MSSSISVESYVKSLGQPELLDLIVQPPSEDVSMENVEDLRPSKRKVVYTEVYLEFLLYVCYEKQVSVYHYIYLLFTYGAA